MGQEEAGLKLKTARTLKWNTIDKFLSQVLYAVTGVVLANVLSKEDFGLVGSVLIFQAFANIFVDSGFSSALIQRKQPTQTDYSTVFHFNLMVSIGIYIILWFAAPLIADIFHDERLIDLSRVMFFAIIINATSIVQVNRLMKQMNVKMVAVSNSVGLILSGATGIVTALYGWGAWAIVAQTLVLAFVKSAILWVTVRWVPSMEFSIVALRSFAKIGTGVLTTSFLNTVFLYIYNFIIGAYYSLVSLGVYTQADKWSKMGVMSLSQTLTASFLPLLSEVQDDIERFKQILSKTHRFTSYITLPCFILLALIATPLFHTLFGTKWDDAIVLFQLLALRGIFTVLTALYNNYILSAGKAKLLVYSEIVKDMATIVAIIATVSSGDMFILVVGQLIAGAVCFAFALSLMVRATNTNAMQFLREISVYVVITAIATLPAYLMLTLTWHPILILIAQIAIFAVVYVGINVVLKSQIQKDILGYMLGRFRK